MHIIVQYVHKTKTDSTSIQRPFNTLVNRLYITEHAAPYMQHFAWTLLSRKLKIRKIISIEINKIS